MILHTSDGGRTWAQQKTGIDKHLFGIHFYDSLHGCAVGDWGAIVVTEDGGKKWKDVHLPEDVVLYAVRMTKSGGIIVGEFGSVFRSGNQGNSWTKGPPVSEQSLFCLSEHDGTVVAGGLEGVILQSVDHGKTWARAENPLKQAIYGIDLRGKSGYAVGDRGTVLRTTDKGKTWKVIEVPLGIQLFWFGSVKISPAVDSITGFGMGAHGISFGLKDKEIAW